MPQVAPYGSWKSPITADLIVRETIALDQIALDGPDTYWIEMRPAEGGRNVIVCRNGEGEISDRLGPPFDARTRVHEYGGGAFAAVNGTLYFSNFSDQRLYRQLPGREPSPLTADNTMRYAEAAVDGFQARIICVREDHTQREPVNAIVTLALEESQAERTQAERTQAEIVLVGGNDFFSSPRVSPDGNYLAWLTWNHPNMPWDGSELWVGELKPDGAIGHCVQVAGGPEESIFQPEWSPAGVLHFVSDRTGWWNLYRWRDARVEPLHEIAGEFGQPQWLFGRSSYAFESPGRIVCAYAQGGIDRLAVLDVAEDRFESLDIPFTQISSVRATQGRVVFTGGSPTEAASIVQLDLPSRRIEILRSSSRLQIGTEYLTVPQVLEFPTEEGLTAHAFFYPPKNPDYAAPSGERPPLLVKSHGGPTAATSTTLNLSIQYWTSRGIAVLDVNYGGSTGYGRAYRERLKGQWGIVDVDDCVNGARYLIELGEVDSGRLAIDGRSAGGYTTLCALTFREVFKAGASYYGVSDLEALVRDTHKFESRYLDGLVGPYPEKKDLYQRRSPINYVDLISCPIILFQGLEDRVVPASQAELMREALRAKGLPVAYIPFEGEQHGFRRAENIKRSLEAEYYFYSRIFGFTPADPVDPVLIENL